MIISIKKLNTRLTNQLISIITKIRRNFKENINNRKSKNEFLEHNAI